MKSFYVTHTQHKCSRRSFLGTCASCTASIAAISALGMPTVASAQSNRQNTRIMVISLYPDPDKPNWPNIGYDFEGKIKEFTGKLHNGSPEIEFISFASMSGSKEDTEKLLAKEKNVDGYIVYLVGCLWGASTETIAASGKPTVIVDHLYAGSGEFLTSYASVKRAGHRVMAVSSSDFNDVIKAVRTIECLIKIKQSTALVIGGNPDPG